MLGKPQTPSAAELLCTLACPVLRASEIALDLYRSGTDVMYKQDQSPLTKADLAVDEILYEALTKNFPNIPVVTEERSKTHAALPASSAFFLVDPIDGTKEFINKRDAFTINVALVVNNSPVFGIVMAPALDQFYCGSVGEFANQFIFDPVAETLGSATPIKVAAASGVGSRVVASRSHLSEATQAFIDANEISELVTAGSSLKFCTIAKGEADIYPRFGPTMEWDTAAGQAVLVAAGGKVERVADTAPSRLNGSLLYGKDDYRNCNFIAFSPDANFVFPEV